MKIVCILCATICLCCGLFVAPPCYAEELLWVRVLDDGVYVFAESDLAMPMFQLQKSYYATVLEEFDQVLRIAVMPNTSDFPQISGFVRKSQVESCTETPLSPLYPTEKITVSGDSAQLKLSPSADSPTVITVTNTQKMSFYGMTTYNGEVWYYVYFGGMFGYVRQQNVTQPVIALHPTPLPQPVVNPTPVEPDTPNTTPNKQNSHSSAAEIVLIVFVVLLALGICLALFLPGNLKKKEDVFSKDI